MRRKHRGNRRDHSRKDKQTGERRSYNWVVSKAGHLCSIRPCFRKGQWYEDQLKKLKACVWDLMSRTSHWRQLLTANSHVRALCHHEVAHFSQASEVQPLRRSNVTTAA
jgi:hypothetical protein